MGMPDLKKLAQPFSTINMTPMIDIVFLLIIFFMVVCQFIQSENFEIEVPQRIDNAREQSKLDEKAITLSVQRTSGGDVLYAVGAEVVKADNIAGRVKMITASIDEAFGDTVEGRRIVNMRMSEDLVFAEYKAALAAVASSNASDIQLAVFRENRHEAAVSRR